MFDFGSKKICRNMPFQATSEKKLEGEGEGVQVGTKLSLDPWMFSPPPVSKILATHLIKSSLFLVLAHPVCPGKSGVKLFHYL